jgi:hypothetical protein
LIVITLPPRLPGATPGGGPIGGGEGVVVDGATRTVVVVGAAVVGAAVVDVVDAVVVALGRRAVLVDASRAAA